VTIQSDKKSHIVIVGGGMVGISLALLLARQHCSWDITLIESLPLQSSSQSPVFVPSFDARSTALSAGSVDILMACGVWADLHVHAQAIRQVHISDRGHYNGSVINAADHNIQSLGFVIENQWLGQVLLHHLQQQNIHCLASSTVNELCPVADGVTITVEHSSNAQMQTIAADLVLIADGAESPLRQALGIDTTIYNYQQAAVIANIAIDQPHNHVAYERFTDNGPLALLPLTDCDGQHRYAVVWTHAQADLERVMAWDDATFIERLQAVASYRLGHITQVGKRQSYPLALVQACEQVRSSIVIIGNAAHFLHPVAGQGFNLALRDCAALVDTLVDAHYREQPLGRYNVLKHYEQRQQMDQQLTVSLTHQAVKLFSNNYLPAAVLRQLGLLSLNVIPGANQALAKQLMGKTTNRPHRIFAAGQL